MWILSFGSGTSLPSLTIDTTSQVPVRAFISLARSSLASAVAKLATPPNRARTRAAVSAVRIMERFLPWGEWSSLDAPVRDQGAAAAFLRGEVAGPLLGA